MGKHRHSAENIPIKLRYARDAVTQQDIHLSKLECYKRQIIIGLPLSSTLLQDCIFSKSAGLNYCQGQTEPKSIHPGTHTGVRVNAVVVVLPIYHAGDDL